MFSTTSEWQQVNGVKRNFDVKRDFQRKLEQLEKRTDAAVAKLVRKQIFERQGRQGQMKTLLPGSMSKYEQVEHMAI